MLLSYDSLVYLKGYWEYYVSQNERQYILIVKKILIIIIKKEMSTQIYEEICKYFNICITKHFIGHLVCRKKKKLDKELETHVIEEFIMSY